MTHLILASRASTTAGTRLNGSPFRTEILGNAAEISFVNGSLPMELKLEPPTMANCLQTNLQSNIFHFGKNEKSNKRRSNGSQEIRDSILATFDGRSIEINSADYKIGTLPSQKKTQEMEDLYIGVHQDCIVYWNPTRPKATRLFRNQEEQAVQYALEYAGGRVCCSNESCVEEFNEGHHRNVITYVDANDSQMQHAEYVAWLYWNNPPPKKTQ